MTVSLLDILVAARAHAAPLAAESAGYLLLGAADHVAVAARQVTDDEIELSADGSVRLRPSRRLGACSAADAELGLRRLLHRVLEVSSSVGPALRRAASREEPVGLDRFVRELETALIPVNRSAARRALSRVYRETERARASGKLLFPNHDEVRASEAPPAVAVPEPSVAPVAPAPAPLPVSVPIVSGPPAPMAEVFAADFPDLPTPSLPLVRRASPPLLELPELPEATPEPQTAEGDACLTRPEPVVQRAKLRGGATPTLGTVVTAQTFSSEEAELTERAPIVLPDEEDDAVARPSAMDEDIEVDVDFDFAAPQVAEVAGREPCAVPAAAEPPAQLADPEPSVLPDVVLAMVALHSGVEIDEAPTRIRDVVTAPREEQAVEEQPDEQETPVAPALEPVGQLPAVAEFPAVTASPAPEAVEDTWLTQSSLEEVTTADRKPEFVVEARRWFVSELTDPVFHEARTWDPGPVVTASPSPLPPSVLIGEPPPAPSPYAPAVLSVRTSDVSELLDSFYVSDAPDERELRGALKEMADLEPSPAPHPLVRVP